MILLELTFKLCLQQLCKKALRSFISYTLNRMRAGYSLLASSSTSILIKNVAQQLYEYMKQLFVQILKWRIKLLFVQLTMLKTLQEHSLEKMLRAR